HAARAVAWLPLPGPVPRAGPRHHPGRRGRAADPAGLKGRSVMAEAIITPHVEEPKKKAPAPAEETALITGSEAIAVACKLADVDVITAYPIRPYDTVMQYVAKLVSNGEMDCEYIVAEGEHS